MTAIEIYEVMEKKNRLREKLCSFAYKFLLCSQILTLEHSHAPFLCSSMPKIATYMGDIVNDTFETKR